MSKHHDPTLQDVAREAGVSLATASRVLNGSTRAVAPEYRKRVEEAAVRVGYAPNLAAQAMARGMANLVALVVGDIADPYFSQIAAGVSRAARAEELHLTMAVTEGDSELEVATVHSLRGQRPKVILLAASRRDGDPHSPQLIAELQAYRRTGGHICIIGPNDTNFTTTHIANEAGARDLGKAMRGQGYTRAVIVAGVAGLRTSDARVAGFLEGFGDDAATVVRTEFNRDGGYRAATSVDRALLEDPGTVVFAVNDAMAVGFITGMRNLGLRPGTDCGVAGFDDVPLAQDMDLTTVQVDLIHLGELALAKALKEPADVEPVTLPATVVLRGSTK